MIRRLFQLAIVLLIANALYQTVPISVHYVQFKDALGELALFSQKSSDTELVDRVLILAEEHKIPLERDYVQISRTPTYLTISASYIETMHFVPGYEYAKQIDLEAKAYVVKEPPER